MNLAVKVYQCHLWNNILSNISKAILSQFNQKSKSLEDGTNGDSDDKEEEVVHDEEDGEDEIDLADQVSDEAVLEEITHKVGEIHKVSVAEENLGHFALTKVWLLVAYVSHLIFTFGS
jgi:hypothetical protein